MKNGKDDNTFVPKDSYSLEQASRREKTVLQEIQKLKPNGSLGEYYDIFIESAVQGFLLVLVELLKKKKVLNVIAARKNIALRKAIEHDHSAVANKLLEYPSVQTQLIESCNYSVLDWAIKQQHTVLFNELLESFVVRAQGKDKIISLLHWATSKDYPAIVVAKLLKYPAVQENIAASDNQVLCWAAANGYFTLVNQLLKYPVVRENITASHNYALRRAVEHGHLAMVNRLLAYPDVQEQVATYSNDAINTAAHCGYLAIVSKLLEYPTVQAIINANNDKALLSASERCHYSIVRSLLEVYAKMELHLPFINGVIHETITNIINQFNTAKNDISSWMCKQYSLPLKIPDIIFKYNNHLVLNDHTIFSLVHGFTRQNSKDIYMDINQLITHYYDPLGQKGKRQSQLYDQFAFKGFRKHKRRGFRKHIH